MSRMFPSLGFEMNEEHDSLRASGAPALASTNTGDGAPSRAAARTLPDAIIERLLAVGRVEWGAVGPKTDEDHLRDFADTLRITRETHEGSVPTILHGLYLKGTATVLCHTGTSPNSGQHARILVAAWNEMHDLAATLHAAIAERGAAPDNTYESRKHEGEAEVTNTLEGRQ